MEAEFWHSRWSSGQLGFHQDDYDRILTTYWSEMGVPSGCRVLVPLCGKSLDMKWLRNQSHSVVGVELSSTAISDFFAENDLAPAVRQSGNFTVSSADEIEIWCGDFFALPKPALEEVAAIYDRGSMVALPPDMRRRYTGRIKSELPDVPIFLSCVDYDQDEMDGPPFSIPPEEVEAHYGQSHAIQQVHHEVVTDFPERFRLRGLTSITNAAYILRPGVNG